MPPTITVIPTGAPIGAEIQGISLSDKTNSATFAQIQMALHRHGLLIFRNQQISPEHHLNFSRWFGSVEVVAQNPYALGGYPGITLISNAPENGAAPIKPDAGKPDAGKHWHADSSYKPAPSQYTLMHAVEVPVENGRPLGDELFVSAEKIYAELPADLQQRLQGLRAIHRRGDSALTRYDGPPEQGLGERDPLTSEPARPAPDMLHPVVRTHPKTGRKALYVNEALTVGFAGMDALESDALLNDLYQRAYQNAGIYRHAWREGDFLVWDNCAIQHRGTFDYAWPTHRRLMRRTSIAGATPV